jgi:hypothetical protein
MSRKISVLTLAVGGVCCFGVSKASAQFLAGNVWPNPDLSQSVQTSQTSHVDSFGNKDELNGVDQIYSYYDGTSAQYGTMNNTVGDANPRPNGWHRGGGDFGVTTTPQFCFYNTPNGSAVNGAEGNAPAGLGGYALEVSDDNVNSYGEWFSDWNPLGAVATAGSGLLQFWYEDTAPQPRDGQLRVTINFGSYSTDDILTGDPSNLGHIDTTFNNPSAGVGTWTEVDVPLGILPAGTESARITIDSGGGGDTTGDIWVSDISVAVPEPASIGIVTAGSMLLLARRRRAKAAV